MNIIYSASGVLCLLYIGLLLSKPQKELKDYLLSGWFVLILLGIVVAYFNYNQMENWRILFEFTDGSVFLHGPIIWFYTLAITEKSFGFKPSHLFHLLPFLIGTFILMTPYLFGHTISDLGRNIILISKMSVLLVYTIAVLIKLSIHETHIGDVYSFTEKVDLNWLKFLMWSVLVIWVISVSSLFLYYFGVDIPQYGGLYTNLAISLFVLIMGYFGIRQTNVFTSPLESNSSEPGKNITIPTEEEPKIPKNDKKFDRLEQYMETHKPYLDQELTLYKLAGLLEMPPYQLSQLINQYGGKNFFNFVNQYRVEEVQKQIQAKAHIKQTLLAVALASGFNSKASFNRVFKKITGKTPRQYASEVENWG